MNNRQKKKEGARVHNNTMDIATNIFPVGACSCEKGELFMYLASNPENIFNIYCTNCIVRRNLNIIDQYTDIKLFYNPSLILKTLVDTYGEEQINKLWENKWQKE